MTAAEHIARAEQLLADADKGRPDVKAGTIATIANAHATLALAMQQQR